MNLFRGNLSRGAITVIGGGYAGIVVGVTTVLSREVIDVIDPASLGMLRYAIGFSMVAPFVAWTVAWPQVKQHLPRIFLLGAAQFGLLVALMNLSVVYISAALATIVFSAAPVSALILATAVGQERPSLRQILGIVAVLLGVVLAIGDQAAVETGEALLFGLLAVGTAVLASAGCAIGLRGTMDGKPPIAVTVLCMASASLALLPFSLIQTPSFTAISTTDWSIILAIGVISGLGACSWIWTLKHADASTATSWISLGPIVAAILDYFVFGLPLGLAFVGGLALVVLGLVIVTRKGKS